MRGLLTDSRGTDAIALPCRNMSKAGLYPVLAHPSTGTVLYRRSRRESWSEQSAVLQLSAIRNAEMVPPAPQEGYAAAAGALLVTRKTVGSADLRVRAAAVTVRSAARRPVLFVRCPALRAFRRTLRVRTVAPVPSAISKSAAHVSVMAISAQHLGLKFAATQMIGVFLIRVMPKSSASHLADREADFPALIPAV